MITIDHTDGMLCWRPFNYLLVESLLHLEDVKIVYVYTNVYGLRGPVQLQLAAGMNTKSAWHKSTLDRGTDRDGWRSTVQWALQEGWGKNCFNKKTLFLHC